MKINSFLFYQTNIISDHDAQLIAINNPTVMEGTQKRFYKREINKNSITEFQHILTWEQWNDIFESTDVNNMFNNFLNTFLRCFYASLKKKKKLDIIITKANGSQMEYEFHAKERENLFYYVKVK
jgi:hypothetical protein